jgi:hypothetical protein
MEVEIDHSLERLFVSERRGVEAAEEALHLGGMHQE